MLPYFVAGVAAVGAGAASSIRGLRGLWWFLPSAVLVGLSACRATTVGTDTSMYRRFFMQIDPSSISRSLADTPQEPGFVLLMYAVRQFTDNFAVLLAVCTLLTVLPVLVVIRRESLMPVFSLALYLTFSYYVISFNGIRQSIAVSFVLLAETYRHRNRAVWILLYALAAMFHVSAILAFILILWARHSSGRPMRFLVTSIAISGVGLALLMTLPIGALLGLFNERYEEYLEIELGAGIGTFLVLLIHLAIVFFLIYHNRPAKPPTRDYVAIYALSCGVLALALANLVIGRFEPYFGIFVIIALPNVIAESRHRHARGMVVAVLAASVAFFVLHASFYNDVVPYQFA